MAVILPKSVFLHNRKTGGMWVREALGQISEARVLGRPNAANLRDAPFHIIHMTFRQARQITRSEVGRRRFFFTFVRNPFSWLESFYAHRLRGKRPEEGYTFERWLLDRPESWVMEQHQAFTGPPNDEVDFVGRYEDLRLDLRRALRAAGEDFEESIFDVEPQNVGDPSLLARCTWTEQMRERVVEENGPIFERYGYDKDVVPERIVMHPESTIGGVNT